MAKAFPDLYAGNKATSSAVGGYENEPGNSKQGTGVKAVKAQGERVNFPGDKTMQSDEHLFRGLTRGTEAPMPKSESYGIGESEDGRDVMRLQASGRGPMEGDYSIPKGRHVGASAAGQYSGSGDPSRN